MVSPLDPVPSGPLTYSPPNQTGLAVMEQITHLFLTAWHDQVNNLGNNCGEKEYSVRHLLPCFRSAESRRPSHRFHSLSLFGWQMTSPKKTHRFLLSIIQNKCLEEAPLWDLACVFFFLPQLLAALLELLWVPCIGVLVESREVTLRSVRFRWRWWWACTEC